MQQAPTDANETTQPQRSSCPASTPTIPQATLTANTAWMSWKVP